MEKCSELVMRLHGSEATEGMFDLVFGRNLGVFLVPPIDTWKFQTIDTWKFQVFNVVFIPDSAERDYCRTCAKVPAVILEKWKLECCSLWHCEYWAVHTSESSAQA